MKSIELMGLRVVGAALILLAGFWISNMLQRFLLRRLDKRDSEYDSAIGAYQMIIRIITISLSASLALHTLGIDLTPIFTTGGLFAVAAAFAMKTAVENFISGLVIRLEKEFKPGDVLAMSDGSMFMVKKIGLRATIVRSKAEGDLIVPNVYLIQNVVSNYTYRDSLYRLETEVGVSYDADLKHVKETLEHVSHNLQWRSRQVQPLIFLDAFGDSSVNFKVRVWIENPWNAGRLRGQLNESIWWELKEAGIVIPYPQRDVHFIQESPVPTSADIS